jgi:hypothetical protein
MMIMMMIADRSIDRPTTAAARRGGKEERAGRGEAMASEIDSPGPERSGKEDEEKFPSDETGTSGEAVAAATTTPTTSTTTTNSDTRRRTRTTAGSSRKEEDDGGGSGDRLVRVCSGGCKPHWLPKE